MSERKNEIIIKPFIYGSIAMYLGKKGQQNYSYKWCVYVRGVHNENISNFIKEVQFTLHDSFENKVRVIPKWPFELYETGWGEFEIKIKIFLVDESIKPLEVVHPLKLFPQQSHIAPSSKRPVIEENYDEIIFVNPKPHIRELLMKKYDSNLSLNKSDDEKNYDNGDGMNIDEGDDNNSIEKNGDKNDLMDIEDDKRDGDKSKDDEYDKKNNDGDNKNDINSNSKIPNISQYFKEVDDSSNLKDFEEHNLFITNEISNLKHLILEKEKQISDLMKSIKELK